MIKKTEEKRDYSPETLDEERKRALERGDNLTYLNNSILTGIPAEYPDLLEIGQAEKKLYLKSEKNLETEILSMQEEIELEKQTQEIENNPNIIKFLREAKAYDLDKIIAIREKKGLLQKYFLKFQSQGSQHLKLKRDTKCEESDNSQERVYTDVEIRDLFRNVVTSYIQKYDLYLPRLEQKRDMRFLEEVGIFENFPDLENHASEKSEILKKYFPELSIDYSKDSAIDSAFQKKVREKEIKLNLLKNNALENGI